MFHQGSARLYRRLTALAGALAVAATAASLLWWPHHGAHNPTGSSTPADVIGRAPATGKLHLMAFLITQPDIASTPSRSQAVAIESLLAQYGAKGLTAQILDEGDATKNALINTYYDWQLGNVRLTGDPGRSQAERFHVAGAPTTLLVDDRGTILARWDSYVLTAQAAETVVKELG